MKFIAHVLLTLVCGVASAPPAAASLPNVFVAQTAAGAADGASCAGAFGVGWFNTSANWGMGGAQVGPGTTVHLCGTFTGAANGDILTARGSGTSGSPITILWETGARLTSPSCRFCFNTNGNTFLVLDGNGTSPSITNTNNGSPAGGYAFHSWAVGINAAACGNCEFKNLTVSNMYVFTDAANDHTGGGTGIVINGSSNIRVHGNTFDQMNGPVSDGFGNGDTNVSIYDNTFDHFNHGIEIGNNNANVINGVFIYGNHFRNMATWDDAANDYHHDGILFYQNSSIPNTVLNFYVYRNLFDGAMGNNATAWIYFNSGLNGIYVFNNILTNPGGSSASLIEAGYAQTPQDQNLFIYNNYYNCNGGTIGLNLAGFNNVSVQNNAYDACQVYLYGNVGVSVGTGLIGNNVYGGARSTDDAQFKWNAAYITLAALNAQGIDVDSITPAASGASAVGAPPAGAAVMHDGIRHFVNLTARCTGNLTPLCADFTGRARPAAGSFNWDAGAFSVAPAAPDLSVAPPTSLSAIVR